MRPLILTIGNFDGVHQGHQALLQRVKALARQHETRSGLITFENHPSQILKPGHQPVSLLCSLEYKRLLLQRAGIDSVIALRFTQELSQLTAEEFLLGIQRITPFSHLILGHDALLGKDRLGNREVVCSLASRWNFSVEYLEQVMVGEQVVSSTLIRHSIAKGDFAIASQLLGRRFSLYGPVIAWKKGERKGIATLDIQGLCLPPAGLYIATVVVEELVVPAIAHLDGEARKTLTVELLNKAKSYPSALEVQFSSSFSFVEENSPKEMAPEAVSTMATFLPRTSKR